MSRVSADSAWAELADRVAAAVGRLLAWVRRELSRTPVDDWLEVPEEIEDWRI